MTVSTSEPLGQGLDMQAYALQVLERASSLSQESRPSCSRSSMNIDPPNRWGGGHGLHYHSKPHLALPFIAATSSSISQQQRGTTSWDESRSAYFSDLRVGFASTKHFIKVQQRARRFDSRSRDHPLGVSG